MCIFRLRAPRGKFFERLGQRKVGALTNEFSHSSVSKKRLTVVMPADVSREMDEHAASHFPK